MHEPGSRGGDATVRGDRLDSWKEIATYLGRGVTTVQRWEQLEGLPVHRLAHAKKGSVFALRSELDAWRVARAQLGEAQPGSELETAPEPPASAEQRPSPSRWLRRTPAVGLALAVIITALALTRAVRNRDSGVVAPKVQPVVAMPLAIDDADEQCPSLSPDGNQVVYYWARDREPGLYIKPVGGGPPQRVPTDSAGKLEECAYAKWSPTGDLIAFLGQGDADTKNIWVIAPSGGKLRRLTSESGIGLCWTPDGQSLGFVDRNSHGEPFSIFVISAQGGQRKRLTAPALGAFGDTDCSFSPDGRHVAIVRYPNRSQSDLFVAAVDDSAGPALERLTTGLGGIEGIAWAPDGRFIVLGTHHGLWHVPVTGVRREPTAFAAFEAGARYPTFSSGRATGSAPRLAYESHIIDVNIWRWDAATARASKVAGSTWWEDFPAASPNGDRIAFASDRTGSNEIWTANADGSDVQQVTFHRGPVVIAPSWSPDGTRIAFSSQVAGNRDIYVIRPDGSQSLRVTNAPSEEGSPTWSRDGRWVYYRSDQGGIGQIWKVPASGGAPTRVTVGEAYEGAESPNGKLFYFVRNTDVAGLWSVPVNGGSEKLVLPEVREGWWSMAEKGIYFFVRTPPGSPNATSLRFFDVASSKVTTVPGPPTRSPVGGGLSVPRDGRFVLWTQVDKQTTDLMLIDPWKP